ncbi:unnamed protein product, partial [Prorocentrum cordatum]
RGPRPRRARRRAGRARGGPSHPCRGRRPWAVHGGRPCLATGTAARRGRRREPRESSESRDRRRDKRKRASPAAAPPSDKREKADRRDPKRDGGKDRKEKDRRREEGAKAPEERRRRQDDQGEASRREDPPSARRPSGEESPPRKAAREERAPLRGARRRPEQTRSPGGRRSRMRRTDDQRDLSTDEEARDKKLEEARKRREAIMKAKMADRKSEDPGPGGGDVREEGEGPKKGGAATPEKAAASPGEGATSGKQEIVRQEGMGDMFDERAEAADELKKAMRQSAAIGLTGASGDDWDDEEGYYIPKIGEVMGDRFLVVETSGGRGVFSNVVRAKDQQAEGEQAGAIVAVKILRANDMMTKAAEQEVSILETLNAADKSDRICGCLRHIIRLLSTFAYRRHFCLVFEGMEDDLRGAVKKHTKNKGMSLPAVRAYTKQLIIGLGHMHKHKVIHADIKPDNILIGKGQQVVKFCDLGTAVQFKDDISVSPYLASRFYRAPEVILGCTYDEQVDIRALGPCGSSQARSF